MILLDHHINRSLPPARLLGGIRIGADFLRVVPVISGCLLTTTGIVVLWTIAKAAAQLGFSYPQTALLFYLLAIARVADGASGARDRV